MLVVPPAQGRGDAKPSHPRAIQLYGFLPEEQSIPGAPASSSVPSDTRQRGGGLSESSFLRPDSLQEQSDSLPCRCAASGSNKDRATGKWGRQEEPGTKRLENGPKSVTCLMTQGPGQFLKHCRDLRTPTFVTVQSLSHL